MGAGRKGGDSAKRRWTLRLFGEPALVAPDGASHALERRTAALFALVVLEPGVTRRRLAALLWPDSDEAHARQALRQQLLRIRRLAGEALEGGASLRLAAHVEVEAAKAGPLLGTIDYGDDDELAQWVSVRRDSQRDQRVARLREALVAVEAGGDAQEGVRIATELVEADPLSEDHRRALMRAHYLAGHWASAREAYDRLREMVRREYAAEPDARTEQLARTIAQAMSAVPATGLRHALPPAVLRPPRIIGREREIRALHECWRSGRPAILAGMAGSGKTRLLTEVCAGRDDILAVGARPGDSNIACSLLARLTRLACARLPAPPLAGVRGELARLLPEFGQAEPVRGIAEFARLLRAVEAVIDAVADAGIETITVDDLHFADDASIEALGSVVAGHARLKLLVACRREELGARAAGFLDALAAKSAAATIELVPLDERQVAELLASLEVPGLDSAAIAPAVAKHTGGNPLFVLETVRLMIQEGTSARAGERLPAGAGMVALIERRLAHLSPAALRLARCAAVAGAEFSTELAARVLGVRALDLADAWSELEGAHVLRDGSFPHDLIYEAALASVPGAIARSLHEEIARFLEEAGAQPLGVARHWAMARRDREAGKAFVRAAGRSRELGQWQELDALLGEAAAAFARCGEHDARFEALVERAEAAIYLDLGEAAGKVLDEAGGAARTGQQKLRALHARAQYHDNRGDSALTLEIARSGIDLAKGAGWQDQVVRFSSIAGGALSELRRVDEAIALVEPLRAWAVANLDPEPRADYLIYLGIAYDLANRLADAVGAFEQARAIAADAGLRDLLAMALSNLATTSSKRGQLTLAADRGRQALQLWRESGSPRGTPMQTQTLLAHRLRDIGHFREAVALFEESLAEFRLAGGLWLAGTAHRLALAYSQLGQHARAMKLLDMEPSGISAKAMAMWHAHHAEVLRAAGRDPAKAFQAALDLLGSDLDDGNNRLVTLFATAMAPPAEAEAMANSVAAWAAARERFGMAIGAHVRAAASALAQGAVDRALPQVDAALRLFGEFEPDNFYRGEIWWVAHRVLAAAGREADASRLLAAGRDWVEAIASEHVIPEFRDSFLRRNSVNRALLNAAARLHPVRVPAR